MHLSLLIDYLEELELLYRIDQGGTSLLVPALLPDRRKFEWPEVHHGYSEKSYKYFGRRLGCGDEEKTLLPFGVFPRLQIRLHWNREDVYSGIPKLSEEGGVLYKELQDLKKYIFLMEENNERRQNEVMEEFRDTRKEIGNAMAQMQVAAKCILSSCSNQLVIQLLKGPLPAFPFLTDQEGTWQKLKNILGRELQLHFMCESPSGRHPIDEQIGVSVIVSQPEWLVSIAPVPVPALQVLCCAAKLAANIFLPVVPIFIPSPHWLTDLGVEVKALQRDYLNAFAEGAITMAQEKVHKLQKVEESDWRVLSELLKGKSINMRRDFQLHRVQFDVT